MLVARLLLLMLGIFIMETTNTEINHDLMDLAKVIPGIRLDIRYATINNFTGKQVYPDIARKHCFLQKPAAQALKKVQEELQQKYGLELVVFDGYRPHKVQFIFWSLVPDERYVGNPHKGSRHNRGCAVDVSLVKISGTLIPMPTGFDDFSERAHQNYMNLPADAIANRKTLRMVMEKHGFKNLPSEWWHFDYETQQAYPILDITFEELIS